MTPAIATHLIAAALAASAALWVQGNRHALEIERLKHQATSQELTDTRQAAQDMAGFQKDMTHALSTFQATQQGNAAAQADLGRLLLDLRSTSSGLRNDFAGLPARITAAARPALAEYATTCTAVFEAMAVAGGRMAEGGAGIARQAEGHAADARLIREAWPTQGTNP